MNLWEIGIIEREISQNKQEHITRLSIEGLMFTTKLKDKNELTFASLNALFLSSIFISFETLELVWQKTL